ncbi:MAG: alginate export family protein [Bacteroidota bacterium]
MKTKTLIGALTTTIIAVTAAIANAQMTLTGEIRPRFEYRHGFKSPADTLQKAAMFVTQRTRLNFGYKSDNFKVGIVLQDIRIWGSQSQLNSYDNSTSGLNQGWAEYFFSKKVSIKMGRQEIVYDDERILGGVAWAQQGRSHDAFLLKYTDSTFTCHAGAAYNQNSESYVGTSYAIANSYKEMQYLWLNKNINKIKVSLLALNVGQQSPAAINSTRYITTIGSHTEYKAKPFFVGLNFYYQTGVDKNKKQTAAILGSVDAVYSIKEKISIGLGYEYISGQSGTDTSKTYKEINHSFNPIFGTNHAFNGTMDYFYVGNHIDNVGLQDLYLKVKYKTEKWNASFDVHEFMSAADVLDPKELIKTGKYTAMSNSLGTEIDVTASYILSGGVLITAGYSQFLPTETLGILKGVLDWKKDGRTDQISNWAFIMVTFKPNFLKQ